MKILMVSTDASILEEGSEAYFRMREYGGLFRELHIILFAKQARREQRIKENVFVYPVSSVARMLIPIKAFFRARRILKNHRLDWRVTTQDPFETGLVGWLVKLTMGIWWQAQIHTDWLSPFFWRQSGLNKIRVLIGKAIIRRADRARVVSERIKKSLTRIGVREDIIDVLPIYVNGEKIQNEPVNFDLREKFRDYDFRLLLAARLEPEKNIRAALAALQEVKKTFPRTLLAIAGEGRLRENLEREAKEWGVEQNVAWLGRRSWQETISAMKTADLFLITSVYEGYSLAVVEALVAGTPVVMTDVGVAGELVRNGENGAVVSVGKPKQMAEAIKDLLKDGPKRQAMKERSIAVMGKLLSKEEYLKRFADILRS